MLKNPINNTTAILLEIEQNKEINSNHTMTIFQGEWD